jgi:hypothetical protein
MIHGPMRYFILSLIIVQLVLAQAKTKRAPIESARPAVTDSSRHVQDESWDPATVLDRHQPFTTSSLPVITPDQFEVWLKGRKSEDSTFSVFRSGFRVQLFSTRIEEEARATVQKATVSFPENVYLMFDNPFFKVRLGDCPSRVDADSLQQRAIQQGYASAWIVRSHVYITPPAKSNLTTVPIDSSQVHP